MKVQVGVYKLIFPDGHFYVGSASGKKGFEGRWNQHRKGAINSPKYLQELAGKCGWDMVQFVVLKVTKNKHRALLWEQAYIYKHWPEINNKELLFLNRNRNIAEIPDFMSPETKKKIGDANRGKFGLRGEKSFFYGKHHSEESKQKMREARVGLYGGEKHPMYGKHHTEESKQKIKENHIYPSGEEHPMFGKHHSKEAKQKMSEAHKGCTATETTKQKMSEAHKGEKHHAAKLTWNKVREIREKYQLKDESGNNCFTRAQLAIEYGVSKSTIQHIIDNLSWKIEFRLED